MKELTLCLTKEDRERVTKQMEQITNKQNRQVNHYLYVTSKGVIDFLVTEGVGIHVEIQEESYTSKASFLDLDPLRLRVAGVGRPGQIAFLLFWRIASITPPGASSRWRLSQALID